MLYKLDNVFEFLLAHLNCVILYASIYTVRIPFNLWDNWLVTQRVQLTN